MTSNTKLKFIDISLRSNKPFTWTDVEIPILKDDEIIIDIKWIKNDRLYIKTSLNRWLLSKDSGRNWQVPKGRLPKLLLRIAL